jgi:hypothetical protein
MGLVIGEIISVINAGASIAKKVMKIPRGLLQPDSPRVYPQRKTVSFKKYHNRARTQYWVCGTSLEILTKGELIHEIAGKNGLDFRILLPYASPRPGSCPCLGSCPWPSPSSCPCPKTASCVQLEEYDKLRKEGKPPSKLYTDQKEEAKGMHKTLKEILESKGITIKDHLRLYKGIMFQNITILDDDAFISFYDARGKGNDNITIYCNGKKDRTLMERIKWLFTDMWDRANG